MLSHDLHPGLLWGPIHYQVPFLLPVSLGSKPHYQLPDSVQHQINYFFANGVMPTCIVVGSIFLASDQLFWMEELAVGASPNLI